MPVEAPTPVPTRSSADERERTIARLKAAWEAERISADTFAARVELAYQARDRDQLAELVSDLPGSGQWAEAAARWLAHVRGRVERALHAAHAEGLYLLRGTQP